MCAKTCCSTDDIQDDSSVSDLDDASLSEKLDMDAPNDVVAHEGENTGMHRDVFRCCENDESSRVERNG